MYTQSRGEFFYCFLKAVDVLSLSADQAANVHQMHLLRARMLHFVINLNNYLMTRMRVILLSYQVEGLCDISP